MLYYMYVLCIKVFFLDFITELNGFFVKTHCLFDTLNLDNFKPHLFCVHTFGVRRSIDVLDPKNSPGSGPGKIRIGSRYYPI